MYQSKVSYSVDIPHSIIRVAWVYNTCLAHYLKCGETGLSAGVAHCGTSPGGREPGFNRLCLKVMAAIFGIPERHHVAKLGRQTPYFIGRQVQVHQVV